MTAVAKTVSVKLDGGIHSRVIRLADSRSRSPHWVMREAIERYVEREEKREDFRQVTLAAWQEYRETGLHVTGEEMDAWLASWGTDKELPAPACHK